MKPTIALIAENKLTFWFTGAAATRNSVASKSAGSTFRRSGGQAHQARVHLTLLSGVGLDEDAVEATAHSREHLCVAERSDRDRAVGERPDRGRIQFRADQCADAVGADLQP